MLKLSDRTPSSSSDKPIRQIGEDHNDIKHLGRIHVMDPPDALLPGPETRGRRSGDGRVWDAGRKQPRG